jgi:hypothetical protein
MLNTSTASMTIGDGGLSSSVVTCLIHKNKNEFWFIKL